MRHEPHLGARQNRVPGCLTLSSVAYPCVADDPVLGTISHVDPRSRTSGQRDHSVGSALDVRK